MVHAPCTFGQQNVGGVFHTLCMDAAWGRIQGELTRRGKGLQWLANELGSPIQRVQNWTTRGVPKGAYPEIAAALGKSIDWLAGMNDKALSGRFTYMTVSDSPTTNVT